MRSSRTFFVLGSVALLAGCASPTQRSAGHLQQRLQANLGPQIASHQVTIDRTDDGARVILPEPGLFMPGRADLTPSGAYLTASVTESLLDPSLMQVDVADTSVAPYDLRSARVRSIQNYMEAGQPGPPLPVGAAAQPEVGTPPEAMVVNIRVHCPPGPQGSTWGYARKMATCN
jgi:hypothetical protein